MNHCRFWIEEKSNNENKLDRSLSEHNLKSKIKNLKFGLVAGAMLFALCVSAEAQQPTKVPRIGFLAAPSPSFYSARVDGFRQGLHELGYIEGKNIVIEYRYAEGKLDRLPELATELVSLKVDVIVAPGPSVPAAKNTTETIPIVFVSVLDPVATGLVTSLARPGGNVTGLTILGPELSGKRLELIKEAVPKITRVASLWNSGQSSSGTRTGKRHRPQLRH